MAVWPPKQDSALQRAYANMLNEDSDDDSASSARLSLFGDDEDDAIRPPRYRTIGATAWDMSDGKSIYACPQDMPIVRRFVMFDTRFRDPATVPSATSVRFTLEAPLRSVTRIALHSARVPIHLDPTNAGLVAGDYAMLSINLPTGDVATPVSKPLAAPTQQPFGRALAYVPLIPEAVGSPFAAIPPSETGPGPYFADFLTPIGTLDSIELTWFRYVRTTAENPTYIIPNLVPGTVGPATENAFVALVFYCKQGMLEK